MQIQYLGFQLNDRGRDYEYVVIGPKSEKREFTFTITNRAFSEQHVRYQDAAEICYRKLAKSLDLETAEQPLPRRVTISDQELSELPDQRRPLRKRTNPLY